MMIASSTWTAATRSLAQNTPQTAANPTVQAGENIAMTMTKVSKPSLQRASQPSDDGCQVVPVMAARFRPDGVLQLVQALRTRQPQLAPKEISQGCY